MTQVFPFVLLVPIKAGPDAKSRLGSDDVEQRLGLRRAFARDAVAAALSSERVEVHLVGEPAGMLSLPCLPDEGDGDLNSALRAAASAVRREDAGLAVMLADLPCLRVEDLEAALAQVPSDGSVFVADADGTGTTLLAVGPSGPFSPGFGAGSAARHRGAGAVAAVGSLASLRRDVDTQADLDAAIALGVGPQTAAFLHTIRP